MLPKFLQFLEELESGVLPPQHEMGEENLTLNKVIEKRIKEIVNEFETKNKATKEEVLNSFYQNISKMMGKAQDQGQPNQASNQGQSQSQPQQQIQGQQVQNQSQQS